jgi:exodeoxyribonuclease V gamma subunit
VFGECLARAAGIDPASDPWTAERLLWPLLNVVERLLEAPWLDPLARHIKAQPERRLARLKHLAWLFDQYGVRRPALIESWAAGSGEHWQAELWRQLRAELAILSPPERLTAALAALREDPSLADLPERLAVFGITRMPAAYVELLRALSEHRDVHLMLLHPSPVLWQRVQEKVTGAYELGPRRLDPTAALPHNRLLASWGRDARELQLVLAGAVQLDSAGTGTAAQLDPADSLLGAIQADIRADRRPPGPPLRAGDPDRRLELRSDDQSIRIHACHGRARQVEVLREAILHRLAADHTLEPRDVIVMCPEVEEFAPLIQATFGAGQVGSEPDGELRVRLADRSLRQTNPLLAVLARLLELASARLTASEVLDLIDSEPIRRRFGLTSDSLSQIREWAAEAAINWGLDAEQRERFKLAGLDAGTWGSGLRRLELAVALAAGGAVLYGNAAPAGEIDSGQIELVGALAELIDRLGMALRALAGPHTVAGWAQQLAGAIDALTAVAPRDAWQRQELARLMEEMVREAGERRATAIGLAEVRALIGERLRGRPTRANFRTGHLTVCTLMPMRSVPHHVVCLLGLDDRAFPRHSPRDGDNLLLDDPQVGDRDPRSEDRQLLLDALLAAQDAVIITYSGNDERTNAPRPPAVPVGELLDAVDATARCSNGTAARDAVRIRHPLQPFDPRNFVSDGVVPGQVWGFDEIVLAGARTLTAGAQLPAPPFLAGRLPHAGRHDSVALAELVAFAERPVRAFLRQRLGVSVGSWDDEISDDLPVSFDGLDRYRVGQRLVEAALAGAEPLGAIQAEIARGKLPPGELGRPVVRDVWKAAAEIVAHARAYAGEPRTLETNTTFPGGARLTGTVSGLRDHVLLTVGYSRLNARHRLGAWVRLLALTAAHPDTAWEAVTLGRSPRKGHTVALARIPPLGGNPGARRAAAVTELEALLALRAEGLCEPLPLPSLSAAAWIAARQAGEDPDAAALAEWRSGFGRDGNLIEREDAEPENVLVFGAELPLAGIRLFAPRLWEPLLSRETVEHA